MKGRSLFRRAFDLWVGRYAKPEPAALAAVANLKPMVLVTGGSRGIGLALAHRFAKAGHDVAIIARHADALGYRRFWMAEHHNMPGIASAATAVALAYAAEGTKRIRIGAGGIMLPNHAPYVIAEQFGTLARLFPGRVDLGLGRAPGTDQLTLRALRRTPRREWLRRKCPESPLRRPPPSRRAEPSANPRPEHE